MPASKTPKTAKINARITPQLKRRLQAEWAAEGISESDFVNRSIWEYLENRKAAQEKEGANKNV